MKNKKYFKNYLVCFDGDLYELEYKAKNKKNAEKHFLKDFKDKYTGEQEVLIRENKKRY